MAIRVATTLALAAIAVFGYFSIVGLAEENGWVALVRERLAQDDTMLPGTNLPARTQYTGNEAVDYLLAQVVHFSHLCISGQLPKLSIFTVYMMGQGLAMHTVLQLEGLRFGNEGTPIELATVWETVLRLVPWGIGMPIYCIVYLWTSPIARASSPAREAELLSMQPLHVRCITGLLSLGYVLPALLAALPSPSVVSPNRQQLFLAIWQFFPILAALLDPFLTAIVRDLNVVEESAWETPATRIHYARRVYRYILGITSIVHFSALAFGVFPWIRPAFLAPSHGLAIDLKDIFVPMSIFSPRPVPSMAEGNLAILQYDLYCAAAAGILWVTYISYASSGYSPVAAVKTVVMSLARSLVVGPGGAILWALWDRDTKTLAATKVVVEEKKNQ